jgi:hypothetical protein
MSAQAKTVEEDLSADLLWGVDGEGGIAEFLNIPPEKVYYLIRSKRLPVRKFGHRTIVASKKELRRLFAATE